MRQKTFIAGVFAAVVQVHVSVATPAPGLAVENNVCAVEFDSGKESFSVRHKPSGKVFVRNGAFDEHGGKATVTTAQDKSFGQGQAIEVVYPNGNRNTMALYPGFPFVVVRATRHNGEAQPKTLNRVPVFGADVETGATLRDVRTLGTGGLLSPDKNPGSYAFLAIVNPASRSGVVGGWLTHDRGSGVVFSPATNGTVRLHARIDYGCLRIKPGADAELETFLLGWFDDARFGLEAYADAIAKVYAIKLPAKMAGFCTWYMEKYAAACDEVHLPDVSAVAAKELKPFGFDFVQIDDGWQPGRGSNGPRKNFTTHWPKGPYPSGMRAAADNIARLGLVPGLWFMPFAGDYKDPWFADHQDWFVKTTEGKPYETAWGGTCLDMTHPDAQKYVSSVVRRIAREWRYKFFKMDGFWTGSATKQVYVNDAYKEDDMGDAVFANPDKTNIEALRDGAKLVREAAGPGVFLLGCCINQNMRSFGGTFGLLDAMRVGPDTGGNIGAPHASRVWFLNGRVWWNDPDCVFVRSSLTVERARLNASWTAISDTLFYVSDWMPETPADRLDIVKRCLPAHGLRSRPVDVFDSPVARIWLLSDTRQKVRRDVVALYNWNKTPETVSASVDRIGLPPAKEYVGFDFWANKFVPPFRDTISSCLPPESCRILAVRPVAEYPQLISTSRHVTQGIVDVLGEEWDPAAQALSGVSKVVGKDPYELRLVVPAGAASWRVTGIEVAKEDETAGVQSSFTQDGPKIRVRLTSGVTREIRWRVRFEKAKVDSGAAEPVTGLSAKSDHQGVTLTWTGKADLFMVEKAGTAAMVTPTVTYNDPDVAIGKTYHYRVAALGWNGATSSVATVEILQKAPECPPEPPLPTVYLDALKPLVNKFGGVSKIAPGTSVSCGPLKVNGKVYAHGVGSHSPGLAVYAIPAGATRFVALAGLDEKVRNHPRASVVFQIYGDVLEMGEKPVLLAESPGLSVRTIGHWAFDVPLNARYRQIRLVVTDAGDGNTADHADWVDAGFIIAAGELR